MEGPATLIGFLGLELDTEAMEIRLPQGLTMCLPILHHGTTITFPFIVPTGHAASHSHLRELAGPAHRVQAGLDITMLDTTVEYYFRNSLATSTQKSYNSAKRRYLHFCASRGMVAIPASEHQLCQFVACLVIKKISHSTI